MIVLLKYYLVQRPLMGESQTETETMKSYIEEEGLHMPIYVTYHQPASSSWVKRMAHYAHALTTGG